MESTKMRISPHLRLRASEVAPRCQASTPPPQFSKLQPDRLDAMRYAAITPDMWNSIPVVAAPARLGYMTSASTAQNPLFCCRRRTRWLEGEQHGRVGFSAAPFTVERRCDGEVGIVAPLGPRPHRYTQHARRPIQTALVATVAAGSAVVDGWGIASAASPPFSAPLSAMCLKGGLPATAM